MNRREPAHASPHSWHHLVRRLAGRDRLEPDGSVRGALELPRTATVHWSRGDVLWTVVWDELDVQWLVRYRIRAGARD